jgi:hypothetical protein
MAEQLELPEKEERPLERLQRRLKEINEKHPEWNLVLVNGQIKNARKPNKSAK